MKKFLFLLLPFCAIAQIPEYYEGINFSSQNTNLEADLSDLIVATHQHKLIYTPGVWEVLSLADLTVEDSNKVLMIYGYDDSSEPKFHRTRNKELKNTGCSAGQCVGLWEREHVYPKSLAAPKLETNDPSAGTDAHNLRAVDRQLNSSRSNRPYTEATGNARIVSSGFYPGDEWKGDVARILMYMHIRYNETGVQVCNPNLVALNSTNIANLKMPDLFLKWNREDPPSEFEMIRNEVIYSFQGNRNPFIDNPYLATLTWGGENALNTWTELSSTDYNLEDIEITITPNPTTDLITVSGKNIKSFNLYNANGAVLKVDLKEKTNLAQYPSGVYFVAIHLENGKVITRKVIKK